MNHTDLVLPATRAHQKSTVKANVRHAGVLYGKTIHQLAALARRIPRVISRHTHRLTSGKKLIPGQIADARARIAGAATAQRALNEEIAHRNIDGPELRETTPHRLRREVYLQAEKAKIAAAA